MSFSQKISSELRASDGYIYQGQALPNATSNTSGVFYNAGILSGIEIVIQADTAISVSASKSLKIELMESDTESGTFTAHSVLLNAAGAVSYAKGAELARFVPDSRIKRCMKLKLTADEDLSAAKITAYLVRKG